MDNINNNNIQGEEQGALNGAELEEQGTGTTTPTVSKTGYIKTEETLIREITLDCLQGMTADELNNADYVAGVIVETIQQRFDIENQTRPDKHKIKYGNRLMPAQIADIIAYKYHVIKLITAREDNGKAMDYVLAMYQEDGPNAGTYLSMEDAFLDIAHEYAYSLDTRDFNQIMTQLRTKAPRVTRTTDKDLIAVNNGIFNYKTKELLPFSPEYIFTAKSKVNYNPNAKNPKIRNEDGTYWDVESWMASLSDDKDIVNLLWEVLGAIIRPNVPWNKGAWFYSEIGNNGKGTLCELMRQLCGKGAYTVIPLANMGKDFLLEMLVDGSTAIICDENDVNIFLDKCANVKALITGDPIQVNRKNQRAINYEFHGFMVQCLNEMPRIRDKSNTFFRRQLYIPFEKCFTGKERKEIKHEYLHRPDVLEYVLYRVLNMNYYELSEPQACQDALAEYKKYNDPIRQFISDVVPELQWSLVPYTFLYDLYKGWYKRNMGGEKALGSTTFKHEFEKIMRELYPEWKFGGDTKIRTGNKMDAPEPLISYYGLDGWKNKDYHGNDEKKICTINPLADRYRGMYK